MIRVRTLKPCVLVGRDIPEGWVGAIDDDLAERWIAGKHAELESKPKRPKPESAAVVKGERAVQRSAKPRRA